MKDKVTGARIRHAEISLIDAFARAEATSNLIMQEYWLNKAIEQEDIIKRLKGE